MRLRLSHLTALAVMVALVGAMFVALQSASAAGCVTNPNIVLGVSDTCEVVHEGFETATSDNAAVTVANPNADSTDDIPDGQVTITAAEIGSATVTITDTGPDDTAEGIITRS